VTHKIEAVWKKTSPELEQEIAAFWVAEKALPNEAAALQRAKQAVCIARNDEGKLIAVCSVQAKLVPRLRQRLYYYRTFVGAAHRNSKLVYPMMMEARKALQEYTLSLPQPECIGMLIEFENKGLGTAYRMAYDADSKFTFVGFSPKGLDQRLSYFDGVDLQTPAQVKAAIKAAGGRLAGPGPGGARRR
jgi:hypothetical protein